MTSPLPSPPLVRPRSIPFPPGTFTFLSQVQACDNVELPTGPWEARDCKQRWEAHRSSAARGPKKDASTGAAEVGGSALDDDEEEEEEDAKAEDPVGAVDPATLDAEFLAPFFLALPKDVGGGTCPGAGAPPAPQLGSRRSSTASLGLTRMTPLPSLKASSPTSSHPSPPPPPAATTSPTRAPPAQPIGFLRPAVIRALILDNATMVQMNCRPVWAFLPPVALPPPPIRRSSHSLSRNGSRRSSHSITPHTPGTPSAGSDGGAHDVRGVLEGLGSLRPGAEVLPYAAGFEDWVDGAESRREHMDRVVRGWKMAGRFASQLGGWRDEQYSIYAPVVPLNVSVRSRAEGDAEAGEGQEEVASPLPGSNLAFSMERAACALFGFATFGVHCTAYVEEEGQPLKLWVPRRSATKQTWPSYLDNTVAGGITSGDLPRESIVRECAEEASLPPSFVEEAIRAVSVLSYTYRTKEGWIQPEVQYLYDLRLPSDGSIVPSTNVEDGEVESFHLMEVEEVVRRMVDGEFKPNCAMVLVDFFLRHGYLTPESDTRFLEVATRLRRQLVLPGPA